MHSFTCLGVLVLTVTVYGRFDLDLGLALENVLVIGDIDDDIYVVTEVCEDGAALARVQNDNDHEVTLSVTDQSDGATVYFETMAGFSSLVVSFPDAIFPDDTTFLFEAAHDGDTFSSPLYLRHAPMLFNLGWTTPLDALIGRRSIALWVDFGYNVTFSVRVSGGTESIVKTKTSADLEKKNATLHVIIDNPGTYSVLAEARSEGQNLSQTFEIAAFTPMPNISITPFGAVPGYDNEFMALQTVEASIIATSDINNNTKLWCTLDWGDGSPLVNVSESDMVPVGKYTQAVNLTKSTNYEVTPDPIQIVAECTTGFETGNGSETIYIRASSDNVTAYLLENPVLMTSANSPLEVTVVVEHPGLADSSNDLYYQIDFEEGVQGQAVLFDPQNSNHSYTYSQKGIYNINITFSSSGYNKSMSLAAQVGLVDVYMKEELTVVPIGEDITFIVERFNDSLSVSNDVLIDFGLGSIAIYEPFTFGTGDLSFEVVKQYPNGGSKTITALWEGDMAEDSFQVSICFSSPDLFEATYKDVESPMEVLLDSIPSISGRIVISEKCSNGSYPSFTWMIQKNINQGLNNYTWQNLTFEQPNSVTLVLNELIAETGLYRIVLVVVIMGESMQDRMHLKVEFPGLIARVGGTNLQKVGVNSVVQLDASSSYDPADKTSEKTLTFSWECYIATTTIQLDSFAVSFHQDTTYTGLPKCNIPPIDGVATTTVNANVFQINSSALFEVTVTSEDNRHSTAVMIAEFVEIQPPRLRLECIWNCGPKLVTASELDRFMLEPRIDCPTCTDADLQDNISYLWRLYVVDKSTGQPNLIPAADWSPEIVSDTTSDVFVSRGGWWQKDTNYKIQLEVQIVGFQSCAAELVVYTNSPPRGGSCSVEPPEGIEGRTEFLFSFPDWIDEESRSEIDADEDQDPVLIYEVQQIARSNTPVIYIGGEVTAPWNHLVACGTDDNICDLWVTVKDQYGGVANCTMQVNVTEFVDLSGVEGEEQERAIVDSLDEIEQYMNQTISSANPWHIAEEAAMYSTVVSKFGIAIGTEDTTSVNVEEIDSDDFMADLMEPPTLTSSDPTQQKVTNVMEKFVDDIHGALTDVIDGGEEWSAGKIGVLADSMATAVEEGEPRIQGDSVEKAAKSADVLSKLLTEQSTKARIMRESASVVESIGDLMNGIVASMDFSAASLEPNVEELGTNNTLSTQELKFAADAIAKKRRYKLSSKLEKAPSIVAKARRTWDNLFKVTKDFTLSEKTFSMEKSNFAHKIKKINRRSILKEREDRSTNYSSSSLDVFSIEDVDAEDHLEDLHIQVVKTKNIFTYGEHSKYITSDVVIGSVASEEGGKLHMSSPKVRFLTDDDCSEERLVRTSPSFIEGDASLLFYHKFDHYDSNARICVKVKRLNPSVYYRVYAKVGLEPTDLDYDYRKTIPHTSLKHCMEICIPNGKLSRTGPAFIGLRPIHDSSHSKRRRKRSATATSTGVSNPLISPYWFGVTSVACYSWDDREVDWVASKCTMERVDGVVTCTCDSSSEVISALSFSLAPNTIHFGSVFSKFDIENQAAVLGVLLSLYLLFTLLAVWAHYMDRKSIFKWGVFPMVDNYAEDNYFYLISVHTGLRSGAGTKSNVKFCLAGESEETGIRKLADGLREGFPTGSIVHMVMACEESLGPLQCLRIWHDNTGPGKSGSWYLDKVVIVDLQTDEHFYFLNEEWLCPVYGSLDKVIQVSSEEELTKFQSAFYSNAKKHLTDDHVWLSVFIRPERSRFSRMERVVCCLSFLLLSMITSAMFYTGSESADRQQPEPDLAIGPLRISFQQLYFSFLAAAITAVPLFFIVLIFKRARFISEEHDKQKVSPKTDKREQLTQLQKEGISKSETEITTKRKEEMSGEVNEGFKDERKDEISKENKIVEKNQNKRKYENFEDVERKSTLTKQCAKIPWMVRLEVQLKELQQILLIRPVEAEDLTGTWPYFCRYIGWFLMFASIIVCSFFVILYSMQWGKDTSEEWLSTFFLAFLQSLLIVDPIKVVTISILLVILSRNLNFLDLCKINLKVVTEVNAEHGIKPKPIPAREMVSFNSSLSAEALQEATLRRKVNLLVHKSIREIFLHLIFILIVASLCYTNRSYNDYLMHQTVSDGLIEPKYNGFKYINSTGDYFDWLDKVVLPWLLPKKDAMGQLIVSEDKQFTANWDLYRLGAPRLRQVRMPFDNCITNRIPTKPCIREYSLFDEQEEEFCVGWGRFPCPYTDRLRITATGWYFQSAVDIWGLPIAGNSKTYGGGGYIVNLDINSLIGKAILEETKDMKWIDRHTRAVFLEFTLFCPNNNHFVYVMLLTEFLPMGGMLFFSNIYPFAVYDPPGALGSYIQICEIVGILMTFVGFIYIIFNFSKHKWAALKDFWFMIDVILVMLAAVAVGLFSSRKAVVKTALAKMRDDPTQFVNFNQVVVLDFGFITTLAFIISVLVFRLLRLAAYSKRTMRVYEVLRLAVNMMPSFMSHILLILMSFLMVGMVLFGSTSPYYKSFADTVMTLFLGILGSAIFKVTGLPASGYYVTLTFFTFFTVIVNLFLTNFFLAVLMDLLTVSAQRDCAAVKSDEAHVFQLLWESLIHVLSKKHDPVETLRENYQAPKEDVVAKEFRIWLRRLGLTSRHNTRRPMSVAYKGGLQREPHQIGMKRQKPDTNSPDTLRNSRAESMMSNISHHSANDPLFDDAKSLHTLREQCSV